MNHVDDDDNNPIHADVKNMCMRCRACGGKQTISRRHNEPSRRRRVGRGPEKRG